ncbi:MAG: hypothetical protein ACRDKB_10710 [Actinomycetota bacterium]
MRTRTKAALSLLVLAALVGAGVVAFVLTVSDDEPEATPMPEPTISIDGRIANDHGEVAVAPDDFEVPFEMGDFYFEPTVLEGAEGQTILLEVVNVGGERHNLTSPGDGVDVDLGPGESQPIGVTFGPAGTTSVIFCRFFQDEGMVAALKATEAN